MKRNILIGLVILIVLGASVAYWGYHSIYGPILLWDNDKIEHKSFYVSSGMNYDQWKEDLLDSFPILDEFWLASLSERMNVESNIHPGRYLIPRKTSYYDLLNKFRNGLQDPVKVVVPTKWTLAELSLAISNQLEADSHDIHIHLDSLNGTSPNGKALSMLIPNTYELYWNTSAKAFVHRMIKESDRFWSQNNRLEKAGKLGLSKDEVYTLASIVYRETNIEEEMPVIAGVYLNRLKRGIALQADPTVKYAVGDLKLRRILNKHLSYDSPYNTYLYPGLPPSPISMADIKSIDAVLNAQDHNYLYFCARPDSSGKHAFSENYHTHLSNARKFHQWLNSRNIR